MVLIESIILIVILLFCFYKYGTLKYDYFEQRNVPFEKPIVFFGNFKNSFLRKESMLDVFIRLHKQFNSKIYGIYQGRDPKLVIKDPELIKQILIKDFDHFTNHQAFITPEDDPLFGNALVSLQDQKWKDMRSTLSPAFTGSKMRLMFQLISECCEETLKYLNEEIINKSNGIDLDMKEFFTRYTNDVIASTAFGLKINSFANKNNEFYKKAQKATKVTVMATIKMLLFLYMRPITKLLKIKLFDPKFSDYFMSLVIDTIKYRIENKIVRPDMINLLMEAKTATQPEKIPLEETSPNLTINKEDIQPQRKWTDEEMVAQCFLFFFAGFETTALLLCFASYELMENPEIQDKLYQEISEIKEQLNNEPLSYEVLQGMKYMEMVVSETLRKWPPAVATDRVCNKNYTIKTDQIELEIKIGDIIWINMVGMHYDPENFQDPKKFNPERFSEENKVNINPFTYAPFGIGPRSCIASRLALMEAKALLFYILSEYKFEKNEKTTIPLQLDPKSIQMQPKNGFQLKLTKRS